MKRVKRDCDADNHASIRLAIKNTPKSVENLLKLARKRCRTCIEIFLDSPQIKQLSFWFFRDLIKNRAAIADIKDLIETYPNILELRNDDDKTLLEEAVLQGQTEVVQLILNANEDSLKGVPLKHAIYRKHVEIAELLVRPEILKRFRQSDVELAFKETIGWLSCPESVFMALLAKTKRRALRDTLNLCVVKNNIEAFKAILLHDSALVNDYGPDQEANSSNLATTTPLHLVVNGGRFDLIEFILANFAERVNLELRDSNGRTAFERALATGVPPGILKKFLDMKPQLIHAVVDTKNVSAARLFLREYGCVAYPKEDVESRFKLILGIVKCNLNHLEAFSIDQEEIANILFDFIFEKDALEIYPIEYLLEITAWSFIRTINSILDKCLKLFYLCEENRDRDVIERALRILKLDEIDLIVDGQLINGRYVLFWLHGKPNEWGRDSDGLNINDTIFNKMCIYTEEIVKHLFKEVFEDEEKLAVYYEVLDRYDSQISFLAHWFVEDYVLPSFVSPKDSNAPEKLQIVYKALYSYTPFCALIAHLLWTHQLDEIKDFIKSGLLQLFLVFSADAQGEFSEVFMCKQFEADEKQVFLSIVEPFLSIKARKKFGLDKKTIPLKELARLSVLKQLNDVSDMKASDFIDRIDKLKLPTLMKNYLLYMDKTPFKIFKIDV